MPTCGNSKTVRVCDWMFTMTALFSADNRYSSSHSMMVILALFEVRPQET